MAGSVKDNIVFGCPWDPLHYAAVLSACALDTDMALLPAGDATELGERGINLSGGEEEKEGPPPPLLRWGSRMGSGVGAPGVIKDLFGPTGKER